MFTTIGLISRLHLNRQHLFNTGTLMFVLPISNKTTPSGCYFAFWWSVGKQFVQTYIFHTNDDFFVKRSSMQNSETAYPASSNRLLMGTHLSMVAAWAVMGYHPFEWCGNDHYPSGVIWNITGVPWCNGTMPYHSNGAG